MVVLLAALLIELDRTVRDLVHPCNVAFDDGLVERRLVDEDGFADGDGTESPFDLIPGLRALLRVVVEQCACLCPLVDLLLGALCLILAARRQPLIHARGHTAFEVVIRTRGGRLG
jgi:hypothetical protein